MSLQLNTNIPPYHDDFDPDKNYYRVMYKPGYPIQARELTTTQSMLQDQIEKLASRILANGDQVVPGEYGFNNRTAYVRCASITQGTSAKEYEGFQFVGAISGVKAKVLFGVDENETDDTTFYIQYEDNGIGFEHSNFTEGETLECLNPDRYTATVGITGVSKPLTYQSFGSTVEEVSPAMGFGSLFNCEAGSYFVDGFIVKNEFELIIVDKYASKPTCEVGFLVTEDFVTAGEDPSLLDNAQGYSNFAAPGADRLRIELTLSRKPLDTVLPNYITLVRIIQGNLQGKPDQTVKWDWLWDILAKRTFDESGNYIVRDFSLKRLEYANTNYQEGLFDVDPETELYPPVPGSPEDAPGLTFEEASAKYVLEVGAGLAYVQGYEAGFYESIYVFGDKPRTPQYNNNAFTHVSRGGFLTLSNVCGAPDLQNITGEQRAVAFAPITLFRNFLDGFTGNKSVLAGQGVLTPVNRGDEPLITYHVMCDKDISTTDNQNELSTMTVVYLKGRSAVVVSPNALKRGSTLGVNGAQILIANKIGPLPSGYITPRYYNPRSIIDNQDGFEGFSSTYDLGILTSTYFTEITVTYTEDEPNKTLDWQVGDQIRGEVSGAIGEVEANGGMINDLTEVIIISTTTGEFLNGEPIVQDTTNKTATIIRPGEVVGFEFPNPGDLSDAETITCKSLGAEKVLTKDVHYTYDANTDQLLPTPEGRNELIDFPYSIDVSSSEYVKVDVEVQTNTNIVGYGLVVPAKVTHTLQKTKSVYAPLNDLNKFSADISNETNDSEIFTLAEGSLFSGLSNTNFLIADNFAGDASEQVVNGDLITFSASDGSIIEKLVKFVTKPAGSGSFREKCKIYLTTFLDEDVTGKSLQRIRSKSIGNSADPVVFRLPEQYVKSLESNPEETGLNYQVCRQIYQNVVAGSTEITVTSNKSNEVFIIDDKTSVCVAENTTQSGDPDEYEGKFLAIDRFEIQDDGRKMVIYLEEPILPGIVAKILTSVYVLNAKAKRKILRKDVVKRISYPESGKYIISLDKADVLVVKSVTLLNSNPALNLDLTKNFYLDNGNRDNYYDIANLQLKTGYPPITQSAGFDGTVEVIFDYLEHSNEGDFFTVDSYTHELGIDYNLIPYYEREPAGAASPNGEDLPTCLRDCVDFRPIVNTTGVYASVINIINDGVTATNAFNFRDTSVSGDGFAPRLPVPNSQIQSDIEYYVGKFDSLFLTKKGALALVDGEQSRDPIKPADLSTGIRLYDLRIQPFCLHAKENIRVKKFNYKRYRMKDIYSLDRRIERLEDVISLSLLEQGALNMSVKDAVTGLDRFKNGIIVDNFGDHSRGQVDSIYYRNSIDPKRSHMRPPHFTDQVDLRERFSTDDSRLLYGNYMENAGVCTVPYVNTGFAENPFATRFINLQVYNVFTWEGQLTLDPDIDTFKNVRQLDDLVIRDNAVYDSMQSLIDGLYETGILGTVWGDEEVIINETVEWNSSEQRDLLAQLDALGTDITSTTETTNVTNRRTGGGRIARVSQTGTVDVTAIGQTQYFKDISLQGGQIQNTSYGDRVTDVSVASTMRTVAIHWTMTKCKPNTRVYAFFDGVDVNAWVSPDAPKTDYDDDVTRAVLTPGTNQKGFGQPIITDGVGNATGIFIMPNGRPPQQTITLEDGTEENQIFRGDLESIVYQTSGPTRSFSTGSKRFRFTSSPTNRDSTLEQSDLVDTYAQKMFTSSGVFIDKQETIVGTKVVDEVRATNVAGEQRITRVDVETNITQTWHYYDPVAQTFQVDQNYKDGIFVTELDVFFRTKDNTQGVEAYLLPTEGGAPTQTIIPLSKVTKDSDTVLRVIGTLDNLGSQTFRVGDTVTGATSGARGVVKAETVVQNVSDNPERNETNYTYNLILSNYVGEFEAGEELLPPPTPEGEIERQSKFFIVNDEILVTSIEVTEFGENYPANDNGQVVVEFSDPDLPGGVPPTAVAKVGAGKVYQIELLTAGSGYIREPSVTINSQGDGTDAEAKARIVDGRKAVRMGVATSEDASAATKFKFQAPIYLQGGTIYAFVLKAPTSLEYTCWTSQLGENEINNGSRVTRQPLLGSLFKSQNGSLWTEDQTQDIKFKLNRASFTENVDSRIQLENVPLKPHLIGNNSIETNADPGSATSPVFGDNPSVVKVHHDWHGLAPGDNFTLDGVVGDPGGIPNSNFNTIHTVLYADLQSFTFDAGVSAMTSERGGGRAIHCSYNRPFECLTVKTGAVLINGTKITAVSRLTNHAGVSGYQSTSQYTTDTPTVIEPEKKFYYSDAKQVASELTEVQYNDTFHLRKEKSMRVTLTLSTQNEAVSPVIDVPRTNAILNRNLIDYPTYENLIYGVRSTTVTYANQLASDLVSIGDNVEFTHNNEVLAARVSQFNPITRKITFKGLNALKLQKATAFSDANINTASTDTIIISEGAPDNLRLETANNGSVFSKWISKVFLLENQCDGVEIRLSSIFWNATDIKIYYRPKAIGFDGNLDTINWIPFNATQPAPGERRKINSNGLIIEPGDAEYNNPDFNFLPTPGLCNDASNVNPRSSAIVNPDIIGKSDWQQLTWALQDIAKFEGIQIKIVLTSINPAKCPLIDDLQMICSE